jgi:hypothetical protein
VSVTLQAQPLVDDWLILLRHVISYSSSLSRYVFEYQPIINQMPTRLSRNFRSHLPANAVSTTRNPFFLRDHAKNKSKIKLTVKENRIYSHWADEVSQWEKESFTAGDREL